MDDSDEEYMTRGALFTESLFSSLENPEDGNQEPVRQQRQQVEPSVPIKGDVSKNNNETIDKNGNSAKRILPAKETPEGRKQETGSMKLEPLSSKSQRVENRKTIASESSVKSDNSVPTGYSYRPRGSVDALKSELPDNSLKNYPDKTDEKFITVASTKRPIGEVIPQEQQDVQEFVSTTSVNQGNICIQKPLMKKSSPVELPVQPAIDIPQPPEPIRSLSIQTVLETQRPKSFGQPQNLDSLPQAESSVPLINTSQTRDPFIQNQPAYPVQHRSPHSEVVRPPPSEQHGQVRPSRYVDQSITELCAGVSILTIDDSDFVLESNQRRRLKPQNRVVPIFGAAAPSQDQTTWDEETSNNRKRFPIGNNQFDPGESLLDSLEGEEGQEDITVEPINPDGYEYPEMFRDLRRQFAAQERVNHQQGSRVAPLKENIGSMNIGMDNNEPEVLENTSQTPPNASTSTPRQSGLPLLPPIAKGRITGPVKNRMPLPFGGPSNVPHTLNKFQEVQQNTNLQSKTDAAISNGQEVSDRFESAGANYLDNLTSEALENMSEEDLQQITNSFYESGPWQKFKEGFPFMAEGCVQKDGETGQLKVYSQRLGKLMLDDTRAKKTEDYVYFLAIKPGLNRGLWFDTHPMCLTSAKFPSLERLVLRGYAILAHPVGSRDDQTNEKRWICWNDSLGLMSIISGSARTPLKKQPCWDKQLDIISIHANYENRRFVVAKVVGLTNSIEKINHFPEEVFLVKDAVFKKQCEDDLLFYSQTINALISIKRVLVGEVYTFEERTFELVVVPTFPRCNSLQFRAMLIIDNPQQFWIREKHWIRELLVKKADSYRL